MITRKTRFNLLNSSNENFYMIKSLFNISGTNCAPPQDICLNFLLLTKNNKVCIKMHYSTYVQLQSFEKLKECPILFTLKINVDYELSFLSKISLYSVHGNIRKKSVLIYVNQYLLNFILICYYYTCFLFMSSILYSTYIQKIYEYAYIV